MTEYNVSLEQSTQIYSTLEASQKYQVGVTVGGVQVPASFSDLVDFDGTSVSDKYVIMYNASTGKYTAVNPDEVLSASSTTETTQPGLPTDFKDQLDIDLDDKIDLDAGIF
jgi:hypothetical protein